MLTNHKIDKWFQNTFNITWNIQCNLSISNKKSLEGNYKAQKDRPHGMIWSYKRFNSTNINKILFKQRLQSQTKEIWCPLQISSKHRAESEAVWLDKLTQFGLGASWRDLESDHLFALTITRDMICLLFGPREILCVSNVYCVIYPHSCLICVSFH